MSDTKNFMDGLMSELFIVKRNTKVFKKFIEEKQLDTSKGIDDKDMQVMITALPQFCVDIANLVMLIEDFMQIFKSYAVARDSDIKMIHDDTVLVAQSLEKHINRSRNTYAIIGGNYESDIPGQQDKVSELNTGKNET